VLEQNNIQMILKKLHRNFQRKCPSLKISFQDRLERIMYWIKAKLNASMARFGNTIEINLRANLKTHFKEPGSCLVPFSRTCSWNKHVIWSTSCI